jgi:hypothetical protein
MSPRSRGGYKPGRDRREVVQAVFGVLTVVLVTVALIWVFKPDTVDDVPSTPTFTIPPDLTSTSAPSGVVTTVPATTATSTPG